MLDDLSPHHLQRIVADLSAALACLENAERPLSGNSGRHDLSLSFFFFTRRCLQAPHNTEGPMKTPTLDGEKGPPDA